MNIDDKKKRLKELLEQKKQLSKEIHKTRISIKNWEYRCKCKEIIKDDKNGKI